MLSDAQLAEMKLADIALYLDKPKTLVDKPKYAHKWSVLIARSQFDRFRTVGDEVYKIFTRAGILCPEVNIQDDCLHLTWTEENRKLALWIPSTDWEPLTMYTNTSHGTGQTVYVTLERLPAIADALHKFLYGKRREQLRTGDRGEQGQHRSC